MKKIKDSFFDADWNYREVKRGKKVLSKVVRIKDLV